MIQAYGKGNKNFDRNAETVLHPESCELTCELNGSWTLNLSHPKDDEGRWKGIKEEGVISVPTFMGEKQLFRICEIERTLDTIEVVAYPIFFDSADDCFIVDKRPEGKNGQETLDILMKNTKYSGESDITSDSTAYFVRRNLMDAINGSSSPTFIQRWGGEILYDNYKIIINKQVGKDRGVEIRYGKNMEEIDQNIDYSNLATRIVPVSYNGYTLDDDQPWVDSPLIDKYAKIYTKEIKFENVRLKEDVEGEVENGVIVCDTLQELQKELKKQCEEQYANGIDKPAVSITCSMVDLSKTEEYKNFKDLEQVSLGDTAHCINYDLGITIDARVIKLTYDCILKKADTVTIGEVEYNFFDDAYSTVDRVDQSIRPDGTLIGQQIQGIIDGVKAQLRAQSSIAKKQEVRAIIFEDLDSKSKTFGAMCLGTMGFQIASARTTDGRDWDWKTFGTGAGFFADYIVAGTMLADRIRGGLLELGGTDNKNGEIKIRDEKGNEIGKWDKDGIVLNKGTIAGPNITVGGKNNTDGSLKVLDASGNVIATISKDGISVENGQYGNVKLVDGMIKFYDGKGNLVTELKYGKNGILIDSSSSSSAVIGVDTQGGVSLFGEKQIAETTEKLTVNGSTAKTGKAVLSDGSYFEFKHGRLIGGKTAEGGTI